MVSNIDSILEKARQYSDELPPAPSTSFTPPLAPYLDSALHHPQTTPFEIDQLCQQALQYRVASVFINPVFVPRAHKLLAGSGICVGSVAGFPLGAFPTKIKLEEARTYLELGADEIDMVVSVGFLKAGEYAYIFDELHMVAESVHQLGGKLKVILETGLLTRYEKIMGCLLSQAAGVDFVKTSTGFGHGGATVEDIDLMRRVVGPASLMGVKASGGVRSLGDAMRMIEAGANRIGTTHAAQILDQYQSTVD